jgi:hypothetical protein
MESEWSFSGLGGRDTVGSLANGPRVGMLRTQPDLESAEHFARILSLALRKKL